MHVIKRGEVPFNYLFIGDIFRKCTIYMLIKMYSIYANNLYVNVNYCLCNVLNINHNDGQSVNQIFIDLIRVAMSTRKKKNLTLNLLSSF